MQNLLKDLQLDVSVSSWRQYQDNKIRNAIIEGGYALVL